MRTSPILPGALLGVMGGGQLGRMFTAAARRMGYRVAILSPGRGGPAGQYADEEYDAAYDDLEAVERFARSVDVVTFEFENVPGAAAAAAARHAPVRPSGEALRTTQNRLRERALLERLGLPRAPHAPVRSAEELAAAAASVGTPAVLKTAAWGYDGKGQVRIDTPDAAPAAWEELGRAECLWEAWVPFAAEISVVGVRSLEGEVRLYEPSLNAHERHVLDVSTVPAGLPPEVAREAARIAAAVLEGLGLVGVACVEMFLLEDGRLLVNEIAPRPHNSGHLTIEACETSQFEAQVRAVCGLPLGSTERICGGAAMANLLGDLWEPGEPAWADALAFPGVRLHLYGKDEARPGRKMGHLTATAASAEEAARRVRAARRALSPLD